MTIVETTILPAAIRLRLADEADPTKAKEWIDFQVPLAPLQLLAESSGVESPLGPPEKRNLSTIRAAALRYVQKAIAEEIRRS
jgi:hypothetical protein